MATTPGLGTLLGPARGGPRLNHFATGLSEEELDRRVGAKTRQCLNVVLKWLLQAAYTGVLLLSARRPWIRDWRGRCSSQGLVYY